MPAGVTSPQYRLHKFAIVALIVIGAIRIASTYKVFNHTIDEMVHIACGIEWWTNSTYCGIEQPPLARIAAGLGPYLDGVRVERFQWEQVKDLFYRHGGYFRRLSLARAGELPFFVLAAWMVAAWAWRLYGPIPSVIAAGFITALPPFLGYSGLAITDAAPAATFVAALYCLCRWLQTPDWKWTLLSGAAIGAAVASKYSVLGFFVPALLSIVGLRWSFERKLRVSGLRLVLALVIGFAVIWATYGFSFGYPKGDAAVLRLSVPLPAPEMFTGIGEVLQHDRKGHPAFLLGEIRTTGWWYFFPLMLALKTPIAFLVFWFAGIYVTSVDPQRRNWERWVPVTAAVGVLAVVMPSHLNLGVRHVLPMYPLMAIPAGAAAAWMLRSGKRTVRYAAVALLVWFAAASVLSHPDYFPYFNEIASREPERFRTDSDLDWGQDCARLGGRLQELGIHEPVAFARFGTCLPEYHGIRDAPVDTIRRRGGWIAVSVSTLTPAEVSKRDSDGKPAWAWLRKYEPIERIGRSILLYRVPPQRAEK